MVRSSTHITGASGGLPVWINMANAILLEKEYAASFDLVDLAFAAIGSGTPEVPLRVPDLGQIKVPVDRGSGMAAQGSNRATDGQGQEGATVLTFGHWLPGGELEADHHFQPFWRSRP
jgi:hypothetical protein